MGQKKIKQPDNYYLDKVRAFYAKQNRRPLSHELGRYLRLIAVERFGSWDAFTKKALGIDPYFKFKVLSDEELASIIRQTYSQLGHVPTIDELPHLKVMVKRFGGPNEAMEYCLGTSPRVEILRAILSLTVPKCDEASNLEIKSITDQKGMHFSLSIIGAILWRCSKQNLVISRQSDRTRLWKLTAEGKLFIKKFDEGNNVNRARKN